MGKTRNVDELLVTSNFPGSTGQRRENIELFDFRREHRSPVFGYRVVTVRFAICIIVGDNLL